MLNVECPRQEGTQHSLFCLLKRLFVDFGFDAVQVKGNDVEAIAAALERTRQGGDKPFAIVLDTVKGAGVEEVANMLMNHSIPVNDEKYEKWTGELKAELAALEG